MNLAELDYLTPRVRKAVKARRTLGDDFFGGWEESDIALLAKYARDSKPEDGKIVDFLGIRTSCDFHPWAGHFNGTIIPDLPVPDDQLRAEAIEYVALLRSLESAPAKSFTMAELGASYAPWTCAAAVLAKRTFRSEIRLVALEASSFLHGLIPRHLSENGVEVAAHDIRLVNGALGTERGTLLFPRVQSASDNGGQATAMAGEADYRGRVVAHEEVKAYTLADVLPDGVTDLVHIDIQGSEASILTANGSLLNERVRAVFVGTHSRKIEGDLLDFFHSNRWMLVRERPTRFEYKRKVKNIVGWTTRDGGQYWTNPQL